MSFLYESLMFITDC